MATNKPTGDNARKGAVRKHIQLRGKVWASALDEARQGQGRTTREEGQLVSPFEGQA